MLERSTAWACLATNLLVLPGLGSLVGRRRVGYLQILLAAAGLAMSFSYLATLLRNLIDGGEWDGVWRTLGGAAAGVGVFGMSWLWALVTSIQLIRQAKHPPVIGRS